MKFMRKMCSFILALMLMLSNLSMAFADGAKNPIILVDVYGNANQQAITVCNYLGIVSGNPDGTYLPEKLVTRAELAAMITRALAIPDSALQGYSESKFKDTAGYSWAVPYLAFCESKGIMLGDGQGNAMPGKTINVNEAVTMVLRAVGYKDNSALLTGTWPANYISVAQNIDLYEDVTSTVDLNRANVAQIIYNALSAQKVSVATDGETTYLENSSGKPSTMLSTGLKCTMEEAILEKTSYPDTLISYGQNLGQYCEIYLNEDEEVIAVKLISTLLPGYFNSAKTKFVLLDGTTEFDFPDAEFTSPSCIVTLNSDNQVTLSSTAELQGVLSIFAPGVPLRANLAVDLSGDTITQFYSIGIWAPDDTFLAEDDIQTEISEDKTINGHDLPVNDNDEIDYTHLAVFGATSLADINKDDAVYVYENNENKVVYVEVGKTKFSGEVTEYDDNSDYFDIYTINGQPVQAYKDYIDDLHVDLDVGSTYDFTMDAWGFIYDADKTSGATDQYGIVQAAKDSTGVDNYKVKLYTSDDSSKTLYLSEEDPAEIDWTSSSAATIGAVTKGALIGYSLDSNGDIDAIDNTATSSTSIIFKSSKVLGNYAIDEEAQVFTYDGTWASADPADYDVATLDDIEAGTTVASSTAPAFYILNEDGDVAALFINSIFADSSDDAIYGVINQRTATTTDGEKVYKYTGFIDGSSFSYKTDNQDNDVKFTAGLFGVYAITLDASNQITKIEELVYSASIPNPECSYMIVKNEKITDLSSDKTVITVESGDKFTIADDAVVYKWDSDDEEFTVSKLSAFKASRSDSNYYVTLYDTKSKDADGIASVVIFYAD